MTRQPQSIRPRPRQLLLRIGKRSLLLRPTFYATAAAFFIPGGATADIGCGSGRDAAWLDSHGFPAQGFDASEGLLREARKRHPHITFGGSRHTLPALAVITDGRFGKRALRGDRHHAPFPPNDLTPCRPTAPVHPFHLGGVLYLSWRVTEGEDRRDEHGRLYASFEPERVFACPGREQKQGFSMSRSAACRLAN